METKGLTNNEVLKRQKLYGKNIIPKEKKISFFKILLDQFKNPIIYVLIFASLFSFIINEVLEGITVIIIILIDTIMGLAEEYKSQKSIEKLTELIKINVKVIRNGKEIIIDSSELVAGDIALLESGNKISADAKVLKAYNLTINESILTGESLAVLKKENDKIYSGTSVMTGRAETEITSIGENTELGMIAKKIKETKESKSPLTLKIEQLSKKITILILVIAFVIALLMLYKQASLSTIFTTIIALSISAMPEGLPLALTLALTVASRKMLKKNVLVKKLNSAEALGSCNIIASDKTGTLTINEQTAKKIILPNGIIHNVDDLIVNSDIKEIIHCGFINNEAKIDNDKPIGDSIDIAFLNLGGRINEEKTDVLGLIPYESENKYSATFYKKDDETYCTVKGSLEKILSFTSKMKINGQIIDIDKESLNNQNNALASDGYRVIALANAKIKNFIPKDFYTEKDIEDLIFIGMVAFIDPIRKDAKKAVLECQKAGIKVVMITGDHPLTALAIGKELGLAKTDNDIIMGSDLENADIKELIKNKTIFARVTPVQKLDIVNTFKELGFYVAVTGDGVNDAPALKAANIGIAMGSGTDTAKETANMIITDDKFSSIVEGIKEGRNAYSNIRKITYLLLSCGLAEVLFFILSILFNLPMPLLAIQLLWLNVVTDGIQDMALSFEKSEKDIMHKKNISSDHIFNKDLFFEVIIAGLSIGLIVFFTWAFLIKSGMQENIARGYIMTLMVFMQNIHVLNCRSEKHSTFSIPLKSNIFIIFAIISSIILQIAVMEIPILSSLLKASGISIANIVLLFILALPILLIMELYKKIRFKKTSI
jgi:calcium-translocating P-type ATPase